MIFTCESTQNFSEENAVLRSCRFCERSFNPTSIERHEKICEKTKKCNRRTVFNSFLQRAKEIGPLPPPKDNTSNVSIKRKQDHHLNSTGTSRQSLNNGVVLQKVVQPGREQCPHCDRMFSAKAADRHIAWCREQKSRLPKTPPDAIALNRLHARIKYRAPAPRRAIRSAESIPATPPKQVSLHHRNRIQPASFDETPCKIEKTPLPFKESGCGCKKMNQDELKDAWQKERAKSLDMLAALRVRLSELSTSDDCIEDFILDRSPDDPPGMAKFCYNCGSRYPVPKAKFCCQCGARRPLME